MRPALALAPTLFALTALPALSQQTELLPVTYTCERGVSLPVAYVNGPDDEAHAIALIEGDLRVMQIAVSASGARYREGDSGYQIWSKGADATISYGPDGNEVTLLTDCRETGDDAAE